MAAHDGPANHELAREPVAPGAPPAASPSGTVTFLLSDIQGSTRLLQALGDGYAEVLMRHREILRTAFHAAGGREIDATGDSLFFVFQRARDAVAAAVEGQRALAGCAWPPDLPVRVRMGLHTGEPTLRGAQYVGLDVHVAARICAAAHGGQVLLSDATCRLAQKQLPRGVTLRDLGWHTLKDVEQPERLHQAVIPGLPSEFPPLRARPRLAASLPPQPGAFVGREEEVRDITRLLLDQAVRMLTLTGPGGIGKTRLALEAAGMVQGAFEDGVFFVPLAALTDPTLIAATIARALEIPEDVARPAMDSLKAHLARKRLLLVLDNLEQVASAGPELAELATASEALKLLITSRVVLRLRHEHAYEVPPLTLPSAERLPSAAAIAQSSAVALFVQRAQAANPAFVLTDDLAPVVASICTRLEGLALAIELAAARIRVLSPPAMLARLGSRLEWLKGGARDAPERHRALRQAMAWSYDLLSADEQAFFRRLSVFVGGCSLDAVTAVCQATDAPVSDALDAVAALADKSLVRQASGPEDEPRYAMLETLREFGLERLKAEDEWDRARRAHAAYFLDLAERAEAELTGPGQTEWLGRLEADHDNLRAALAWAEEQGEAEIGLRLGGALWRFWTVRGHMGEGRRWLERLLSRPGAAAPTRARAKALHGLGTMTHEISDYTEARPLLEASLAIWRALGDDRAVVAALNSLGWLAFQVGDFDSARALSEEALALGRTVEERRGMALALLHLGAIAFHRADFATAASAYGESLALRQGIGDRRGSAYVRVYLGWLEHERGRDESAGDHLAAALDTFRELNDKQLTAWALSHQGVVLTDAGRLDAGKTKLEASLALAREVGNKAIEGWALTHLGAALLREGDLASASRALQQAIPVCHAHWSRVPALLGLGHVEAATGHVDRALALYKESLAHRQGVGAKLGVADCLEAIGTLALSRGEPHEALRLYGAADAVRARLGTPRKAAGRGAVEPAVEQIRRELGEPTAASLQAEGEGLSLDQACAHALRYGA
jgi:predicted ATPase/class 3 adenylate cyclase